jgi:predicted RNase H-like HicB family nuclease
MAKLIYPIILHPETDGGYSVDIPDLEIGTQGETVAECIDMARDAIGLWGICQQDEHRPIPEPSVLTPAHEAGEIVTLVDIDLDAYRRANDLRTVRKNVTLPSWLCNLAEEAGVNFSQVLQEGLKSRLHVADR